MTAPQDVPAQEALFYIVDLRPEWSRYPLITFWRAKFCGYAYPLPWSGKYTASTGLTEGDYLTRRRWSNTAGTYSGAWERFAVSCHVVDAMAVDPPARLVDGNVGPVVRNTLANRRHLIRHRFRLPAKSQQKEAIHVG